MPLLRRTQNPRGTAAFEAPQQGSGFGTVDDFDNVPQDRAAYAVPVLSDAPYTDEPGWTATPQRYGPDPYRLGGQPVRDLRNPPGEPQERFYDANSRDIAQRESVTSTDADGMEETKNYPGYGNPAHGANRWAQNPRRTPPPEPRATQQLSPHNYAFTRPFGWGTLKIGARALNGLHFSMADHRREYPIGGMSTPPHRRNTYRIEPTPWDAGLVDKPPANTVPAPVETVPSYEPIYQSRSWRLS
jgi:hypothetical protein